MLLSVRVPPGSGTSFSGIHVTHGQADAFHLKAVLRWLQFVRMSGLGSVSSGSGPKSGLEELVHTSALGKLLPWSLLGPEVRDI